MNYFISIHREQMVINRAVASIPQIESRLHRESTSYPLATFPSTGSVKLQLNVVEYGRCGVLGSLFDPEDGGDTLLQSVDGPLLNYTAL
jgi:hypothetical protein